MDRIPLRTLRNQASDVVRRARGGERLVITVDGIPAAEIGPIVAREARQSLAELVASGLIIPPRDRTRPVDRPRANRVPDGRSSTDILRALRED